MDIVGKINNIVMNFESNISELRIFNDKIGTLAEQHDKATIEGLTEKIIELLGIDIAEIKGELSTQKQKGKNTEFDQSALSHAETKPIEIKDEKINRKIEEFAKDQSKVIELIKSFKEFSKGAPRQGILLRRGALVSLISYYEALISDLIHYYYALYPIALPSDSRVLSLNDLREIGSIEDAEKFLIAKEADSVLREGFEQQLKYFSERLKINLKTLGDHDNDLFEISQRRNIVVHNNAIANRTYIKNTDKCLLERYGIKEGKPVLITRSYLSDAIDTIYLAGIVLCQQCGRKWGKDTVESLDDLLIAHTYEALLEERYHLTTKISDYAGKIKVPSDRNKKIIIINHAIALKALGSNEKMESILKEIDWSATNVSFKMALHALRNQDETFYESLNLAIKSGEINKLALEQWPLFKEYREQDKFKTILSEAEIALPKLNKAD